MSLSRFLTSQTIALQASNSDTSFHVHEHLLRSVSPVLLAVVSREWKGKATRRYTFREDVTEELLLNFLMWAYHGSYLDTNGNKTMEARNDKDFDMWDFGLTVQKKKPHKKYPMVKLPVVEFSGIPVDGRVEDDKQKAEQTAETSGKLHPIILHIKLYVFAEMYMIEPLKALSMEKLIVQLKGFGSLAEGHERAAVFDVLKFAFSSGVPGNDVLLHWLARYASWRLDELKQVSSSFEKLFSRTDGNFATLLMRYVHKSPLDPFNLKMEDIMPQYQTPIGRR